MKRTAVAIVILLASIPIGAIVVGWSLARPVPARIGPPPAELGAMSITVHSESGTEVHGWWCPATTRNSCVLLLPGVRANRLSMVDRARFLHHAGYAVLLIDFQATGETAGRQITFGWKERRDVLAAVSFIRSHAPNERIAIIGSSLGGAAALLATPPLHVDACILEAVYPTIERATNNRLRNYLGPLGPLGTPLLLMQLPFRLGVGAEQLRPVDHLSHAPPRKQLWLVPAAGHIDLHHAAPREYESRVLLFLSSAMGR